MQFVLKVDTHEIKVYVFAIALIEEVAFLFLMRWGSRVKSSRLLDEIRCMHAWGVGFMGLRALDQRFSTFLLQFCFVK